MIAIISNPSRQTLVPNDSSSSATGTAKAQASDSIIGLTVKDRYLIEKQIGTGGFGAVYLARDLELLSKPVVVKILLEESLQHEWVLTKFRHEIEALARIDHPGVVGVLATGSMPDGNPFIVMEYVEGVSLRTLLEETPDGMDFERATHIIHQIGYALNAAHRKGIVHRDLKPENVMVRSLSGDEEQVKIIDFGIAKVKDSRLAPSTIMSETAGTVVYMSPEQLNAQPVSAATDIYSLGAIAYELLTGRRPFNPATMFQLNEIQQRGVRIKPSDLRQFLPLSVDDVVIKALAYEPGERFTTASKFADAFAEAMLEGTVSESRRAHAVAKTVHMPKSGIEPPQRISIPIARRNKLWLIAPLIVVFLATVSLGTFLWSKTKSTTTEKPPIVNSQPANAATSSNAPVTSSVEYYLMVQKVRPNGTDDGAPFRATGKLTLLNGFKFNLHTKSDRDGYLYLLNEGPDAGTITYNLLYPAPKYHGGSAQVQAGQDQVIGPYQLDQNAGKEKIWLVWSKNEVPELEAVKGFVNPKDKGTVSDPQRAEAIRVFLSKQWLTPPDINANETTYTVQLRGRSDTLVNLIELEHR